MKLITFCINTARNELEYIQLLFKSLEINLCSKEHEIIVFIDSDNEGTLEWLLTQKEIFKNLKILKNHLPIPYGYGRNINEMFLIAKHEIVSYLQSDMVISKDYDVKILEKLEPNMILSSTSISPPLHPPANNYYDINFGFTPNEFKFNEFNDFCNLRSQDNKVTNYFFAPFTLYKETWNSIGGHDTMFRRSREDSDILTRLVLNDTKIIQVWNALVYHFTCTSSRGKDWFNVNNTNAKTRVEKQQQADNIELSKFVYKWGNFYHTLDKVKKFNISAEITAVNTEANRLKLKAIECFFKNINTPKELITTNDNIHTYANELLDVSEENWVKYNYMHNVSLVCNYVSDVSLDDIILYLDLDLLTQYELNIISNLNNIIEVDNECGEFSIPGTNLKLKINNVNEISSTLIKVDNPKIKEDDLYYIY